MNLIATATDYLHAGLCVLPARDDEKRPTVASWTEYQSRLPMQQQLDVWFSRATAICVVAGSVSGNLEMIDFDFQAESYRAWCGLVEAESPGLIDRLVVESSQSGGRHVVNRCESEVPGSLKLAQRTIVADSKDPILVCGKEVTPRRIGDRFEATITLIETRGEGGLFLCSPSRGYVLEQGALESPPLITAHERQILIDAARALNQALPPVGNTPHTQSHAGRPGDDYNETGDFREVLRRHGWTHISGADCEYWRRPGKDVGQSATIRGKVFYCFSSNAAPFEPDKSYSPFAVYALLEHAGDYQAAARSLRGGSVRQSTGLTDDYFDSLPNNSICELEDIQDIEITRAPKLKIMSAGELLRDFVQLRRLVIDGLLRIGEVMNVIAPPKCGKSWLVLSLVLAVVCGRKWLGRFSTCRGKVLLVDNELHPETLAHRLRRVAMALGLEPHEYEDSISIICLRGKLMDLKVLSVELMHIEPGAYDLIVLDAWYRLQPSGSDENANGDVTQLYNILESVADRIGSAFVCIHHTTKGNQSDKAITDVGSGAGAQARAADTHMIMRPHEVDGAIVVGASVRSWAPPDPFVVRFDFPVFNVDEFLDPNDLKSVRPRKSAPGASSKPTPEEQRLAREEANRTKAMNAYRLYPDGETQNVLRQACGLSGEKFTIANDALIACGLVEMFSSKKNKQQVVMYRLTEAGQVGQVGQNNTLSTQSRGVGQVPPPLGGTVRPTTPPEAPDAPQWSDFPDMDGDLQ